jgi:hypothetical protein
MGPVFTNTSVDPKFFGAALSRLHDKFGIEFDDIDKAYWLTDRAARGWGGSYRAHAASMSRRSFVQNLTQLQENARRTLRSLEPFRGSVTVWTNRETLAVTDPVTHGERFLEFVSMTSQFLDQQFHETNHDVEALADSLEKIINYCEAILPGMEGLRAKRGQRGLGWYDDYVEVMIKVAGYLGIAPTTDARGSKVADVTPFTMLVYEIEKIFPSKGHSKTPVACARRIERSLKNLEERNRIGRRITNSVA